MSDMKINGVGAAGQLPQLNKISGGKEGDTGFDKIMQEAVGKLNQVQQDSAKAIQELATGGDATQAIVDMEKAEMNFQLMVQVRNKLLSAYDQIMNMQV